MRQKTPGIGPAYLGSASPARIRPSWNSCVRRCLAWLPTNETDRRKRAVISRTGTTPLAAAANWEEALSPGDGTRPIGTRTASASNRQHRQRAKGADLKLTIVPLMRWTQGLLSLPVQPVCLLLSAERSFGAGCPPPIDRSSIIWRSFSTAHPKGKKSLQRSAGDDLSLYQNATLRFTMCFLQTLAYDCPIFPDCQPCSVGRLKGSYSM